LQTHHAVGFGPATVIADAHAHDATHRAPDRKAKISGLKIALFQMLKGPVWKRLCPTREVHFAVLSNNLAGLIDEIRISNVVRSAPANGAGPFEVDENTVVLIQAERATGIKNKAQ
jgi:hypothetical protein